MTRKNDIRLLQIRPLRGPNIWTYRPALEVWLDLGELEDFPSHRLPGFTDRLLAWLPALVEHHCGVGERGGFVQRLHEGTWAGHVLEHVVIELLNLAGMPTGFGQTRSTSRPGVYRMVVRSRDEQVARAALAAGHALVMAAINDDPFDVPAAVQSVRACIDDCYLGPSTACIVAAAADRGIPHLRLNDGNLVQLGHGARQRRIWTAETEATSAIAEGIARDKDLTKTLLRACGVPVPEGEVVETAEAAWEAAEDIGLPVAVKPSDGNHGRGVTLDLTRREDVEAAFHLAERHGSEVLVERFVPGDEHRLLVVGGQVVAAARGAAAWVVGDGQASVLDLIDAQLNTDPRRGLNEDFPLNRIVVAEDEAVQLELQRQGLRPEDVPAAGRRVLVQRNGNVAIDCTDEVHPEVAFAVTLAARVVGLDVAGIDVVAEDIARPLAAQRGAVVEVNAGPGLLMHLKPAEGRPRPVGQAIVDHLFPDDETGRVPIVGIAGTPGAEGTTAVARLVAWLLHLSGRKVGLGCRDGMLLGTRRADPADGATWDTGRRLLMNREVDAIVLENDARLVLADGLAYDRCAVGVVTDLGGAAALGEFDIRSSDDLVRVLRTQVDVVLPDGVAVLNAADPRIAAMAELCDGQSILYAEDADDPACAAHRAEGGRSVTLRDGRIVLGEGAGETVCFDSHASRWHRSHAEALPPATLLPAVAAAWALGVSPELIGAGIETHEPGPR